MPYTLNVGGGVALEGSFETKYKLKDWEVLVSGV